MRNLKQSQIDQLIKMLLDKTYSVFLKSTNVLLDTIIVSLTCQTIQQLSQTI